MQITAHKKIGESTFTFSFEGTDFKDALLKAGFLIPQDACYLEGFAGKPVWWDVRKAKTDKGEFIYVKRKCRDEAGRIASSTLGTYQGGGYFWHEWEIYDPNQKKEETADVPPMDDHTGIPF